MWKKSEHDEPEPTKTPSPEPRRRAPGGPPGGGASRAVIGRSIEVRGELTGDEDLLIEGRFQGEIRIPGHEVTIGRSGRVRAEIKAKTIVVEGELQGNLAAEEQAVVRASGKVQGDITAPRVALDEGCQFKGSIDMEPTRSGRGTAATESPKPPAVGSGSGAGSGKPSGIGSSGSESRSGGDKEEDPTGREGSASHGEKGSPEHSGQRNLGRDLSSGS